MKVGFIGLGLMGKLMSANVAKAGHVVRTYDINGKGNCASAREAAAGAEIVITMVPDGEAVRKAVKAALPGMARGAIVIDMSSSDPATTRELGALLGKKGVHMLDSPVSGAKAKAADGTLALMVGGDARLLEKARPVLAAMSCTAATNDSPTRSSAAPIASRSNCITRRPRLIMSAGFIDPPGRCAMIRIVRHMQSVGRAP